MHMCNQYMKNKWPNFYSVDAIRSVGPLCSFENGINIEMSAISQNMTYLSGSSRERLLNINFWNDETSYKEVFDDYIFSGVEQYKVYY